MFYISFVIFLLSNKCLVIANFHLKSITTVLFITFFLKNLVLCNISDVYQDLFSFFQQLDHIGWVNRSHITLIRYMKPMLSLSWHFHQKGVLCISLPLRMHRMQSRARENDNASTKIYPHHIRTCNLKHTTNFLTTNYASLPNN